MRRKVRLTESDIRSIVREAMFRMGENGEIYNSDGKLVYTPNLPDSYYPSRYDDGETPFGREVKESYLNRIVRESVKNVLMESSQMQFLEDDIRNYFKIDKEYDGSVSMANARDKLLNCCCGDLPWEVNQRKFLNMIYSLPASWDVESLTQRAMEWVEQQSRKNTSPKIY